MNCSICGKKIVEPVSIDEEYDIVLCSYCDDKYYGDESISSTDERLNV